MGKRILVIPDQHAHPEYNNDRADWLGEYIKCLHPDIVVNIGDGADMASLCSYDRGKKSFQGRTYSKDIEAHLDFQERVWHRVRTSKKKLPRRIYLIGNHEERIARAIELQPELEGVIGYGDLQLDEWYDTIVHYSGGTPGTIEVEGVSFSHYSVGGIASRPISGEHHAYSLLAKNHSSTVVGHSHTFDYCMRTRSDGTKIIGVVAGCYQDYDSGYAGDAGRYWYRGLVVLDGVEKGVFDVQTISIAKIKEEYGK